MFSKSYQEQEKTRNLQYSRLRDCSNRWLQGLCDFENKVKTKYAKAQHGKPLKSSSWQKGENKRLRQYSTKLECLGCPYCFIKNFLSNDLSVN